MISQFDIDLGSALRKVREQKGFTQIEIAERLGMTKMAISSWESGKRSMTAYNLKRYCKILGVSVQSIIDQT